MLVTSPHPRSDQKMQQYEEEHDIAAPLIASILWGHSGEQKRAAHQLASINDQIRAKNTKSKIHKASGCIDILAFKVAAEGLRQASTAFESGNDTTLFKEAKKNLQRCIKLGNLPRSWNIEWEEFMDFHRDRVGRSNLLPEPIDDAYQDFDMEDDDPPIQPWSSQAVYHEGTSSEVLNTNGEEMSAIESEQLHGEQDVSEYEEYYSDEEEQEDEYYDEEDQANNDFVEDDSIYSGSDSVESRDEEPELTYDTARGLDFVDVSLLRGRAQAQFGLLLSSGSILGWRDTKDSGMVAIMGYECQGKRTARVKCLRNDQMGEKEPTIGREKRSSADIQGLGLIAWAVDEMSIFEPVKALYPTLNSTYPSTFIAIYWGDNMWTWESREIFHSLMEDLSPFEVDVLLYFIAVFQESEYQERLTGERPDFPNPTSGGKPDGISLKQAM